MENIIKLAKSIQQKYPLAHFGGSFGLLLHGVNLGRPIKDLDICLPVDPGTISYKDKIEGSGNDFDYIFKHNSIRLDIIIAPNQTYKKIFFNGFEFNITDLHIISFYKKKYCAKNVSKHCSDLLIIDRRFPYVRNENYEP